MLTLVVVEVEIEFVLVMHSKYLIYYGGVV